MKIAIICIGLIAVVGILAGCRIAGLCSREEEQK